MEFETDALVHLASREIRRMAKIESPKVVVAAGQIEVTRAGVDTRALNVTPEKAGPPRYPLPDILAYLQNETELTRSTLVRILKDSGRLAEFFVNPQRFMDQCANILRHVLHGILVDGIKYERIDGVGSEAEWEMLLFKDEEL